MTKGEFKELAKIYCETGEKFNSLSSKETINQFIARHRHCLCYEFCHPEKKSKKRIIKDDFKYYEES